MIETECDGHGRGYCILPRRYANRASCTGNYFCFEVNSGFVSCYKNALPNAPRLHDQGVDLIDISCRNGALVLRCHVCSLERQPAKQA